MNRDEIITLLFTKQDQKLQKFHGGLCPGLTNIIGVRTPELRRLAKEILRGDWRGFLAANQDEYYEETLLVGLVIASAKIPLPEKLDLLKDFVPKINNWATCDLTCSTFKFRPADLPEVWQFILRYQNSPQEFERRFMLVMILDHFLLPEYITQILEIVDQIQTEQYYVKMAQAWLLSTAFIKFRDQTLQFLQKNNLDAWTQNKAIQKIRESYRVSKEDKELLLRYKK